MPSFSITTGHHTYSAVVERGVLARLADYLPASVGKVFLISNEEVWRLHGTRVQDALASRPVDVLYFPPGEGHKRLSSVETVAEQMVGLGADRASLIIALGGGIVNDMAGFLAAIFMRGIPVIQIPTTLLAQVDAAVGGKTGVNLVAGKNLIGSFHQPLAVLADPEVLRTLPVREYRAGLYEVLKHGVIAAPALFDLMANRSAAVLAQEPDVVDTMVSESVRIKAEVVSSDEREGGLRRILNFGHTVGHALEAETRYSVFLHGEAVAFGMKAATHLACSIGLLADTVRDAILRCIDLYGPIPAVHGIAADSLAARLQSDKKTVKGKIHFVLPDRIGHVQILSDVPPAQVKAAIEAAMA